MFDQNALTDTFLSKKQEFRRRLKTLESAVVAFSGGVDSALLAVVAHQELQDRMIAILGVSPSVPKRDRHAARLFCEARNIPFRELETQEFSDPNYIANPENRCFFCKQALFELLSTFSNVNGYKAILDGTNASDLMGHRPGRAAAQNMGVRELFVEVGLTKDEIRAFAHELNLEVADKPAMACLSSRVETHLPLEPKVLSRIDDAENILRDLGLRQVRVRHHGSIARIEIAPEEMEHLFQQRDYILEQFYALGWERISLDLKGYGSSKASSTI